MLCANVLIGLGTSRQRHGADDFNQLYIGAKLVFSGHLYDLPRVLELQRETIGVEKRDVIPTRLPFNYVLLWPLARLPYSMAHGLWIAMLVAASVMFAAIHPAPNRMGLAAATAISLPLAAGVIGIGQDVALLLLIWAVGLRLRDGGRAFTAGMMLSLILIKFHLFLLVPLFFLIRREFRLLAGFCTGAIALVALSFAAGADWPREYIRVVSDPAISPGTTGMPNLHGLLFEIPHAVPLELILSALVTVAALGCARRCSFELALAAVILGSFLLSRHSYLHDCAIAIPGLVWIFWSMKNVAARALAATLLTPLPYFLPPLMMPIREGTVPAILIAATLAAVAALGYREAVTPSAGKQYGSIR